MTEIWVAFVKDSIGPSGFLEPAGSNDEIVSAVRVDYVSRFHLDNRGLRATSDLHAIKYELVFEGDSEFEARAYGENITYYIQCFQVR